MPPPDAKRDASFMNGVTQLLVLQLLARREMYGYELVAEIRRASGEVIQLSEGGVYPLLHAMEHQGLLSSRRLEKDGRTRLYYRLTGTGRRRLADSKQQWFKVTAAIQAVLGGADARPA